jgi:hypothetical protein
MNIQINTDKTVDLTPKLTRFIKDDANRVLGRFEAKLTRVELHLSDVNKEKSGPADKRCLIEVRPAGDKPLTATANADTVALAVTDALGKMQRLLTTFFGRKGRAAKDIAPPVAAPKKSTAAKAPAKAAKKSPAKKAAAKKATTVSARGPKKKQIFQARRKVQPS